MIRRVLALSALLLLALANVAQAGTDLVGVAFPGQSAAVSLPSTIGGVAVDPAYNCVSINDGPCSSQLTLATNGSVEVTLQNSVLFTPSATFSGATPPITWQIATQNDAQTQQGTVIFEISGKPTLALAVLHVSPGKIARAGLSVTPGLGTSILWGRTCFSPIYRSSICRSSLTIPGQGRYSFETNSHQVLFTPTSTWNAGNYSPVSVKVLENSGQSGQINVLLVSSGAARPTAAVPPAKRTITCVKGKSTKKVAAVKPMCPAGYKKK